LAIRLIHVGLGVRGRHWIDVVRDRDDYTSVAYVDAVEQAVRDVRALPGLADARFFASLGEAVATVGADAALIASPSALHAPHAAEALDAGLAVLIEKPLAATLSDAAALIGHARTVGRPLMVAENYRFFPAERTVRTMLADGAVGRPRAALCIDRRDQPSHTQGPWVRGMEHPFLTEIAVHHFDSFRYFFALRPSTIFVAGYNPPGSTYERNGATEALIELDGGLPIQYSGTMVATRYEYQLAIEGDRGDLWTDRRRVWARPRGRRFFRPCPLVPVPRGDELPYPRAGTTSLLNQFRDAVLAGRRPETSADDNIWTLAMVEAAILSAREGRQVAIDEVFTTPMKTAAGVDAR